MSTGALESHADLLLSYSVITVALRTTIILIMIHLYLSTLNQPYPKSTDKSTLTSYILQSFLHHNVSPVENIIELLEGNFTAAGPSQNFSLELRMKPKKQSYDRYSSYG